MIQWIPQLDAMPGLPIKSPVTGDIMPLTSHPELLFNANVLPQALCIKLQHGTLVAPFAGSYSSTLLDGRRLRFKHKSGLTMQLDLADRKTYRHGVAIRHLVNSGQQVHAGQAVIRLDLQLLQHSNADWAVLTVLPHSAINAVFSAERFVTAAEDTAFTIQLKNHAL